jgi:hypothetical protein
MQAVQPAEVQIEPSRWPFRKSWLGSGQDQKLGRGVSCPKLKSYWHFHGCRYGKVSRTCAEPD